MGPCMSMIPGAPQLPTINFPGDDVASGIATEVAKIPDALNAAESSLKTDYATAKEKGEDLKVMGGKDNTVLLVTISKDLDDAELDKQIKSAARMQVAKGEFAEHAAEEVWTGVEPKIDEQKPSNLAELNNPVMTGDQMWEKAKDKVHDQVVDQVKKKISDAVDNIVAQKQE